MISLSPAPRRTRAALVIGLACLIITFAGIVFVAAQNDDEKPSTPQFTADTSTRARITERFGQLPLSFERNEGQTDQAVKYLAHGPGYELFLTANEAVISGLKDSVLRIKMVGANREPRVEGHEELPGKVNYFRGNDPAQWRRNIAIYRKVHYDDVYPGIDMVYYGKQGELEYDFVVAPGANPNLIKFRIEGAERIGLDESGNLAIQLKHGDVQLHKPLLYQLTANGERSEIKGDYVIKGNEIGFKVRAFDRAKPLVIDPVLSYSTYLGSGATESALGIAVDAQGSAYVTGTVNDTHFPTTAGAFQTGGDFGGAFVTKLDPTGSSLVYSTYLTGSSRATGTSIAVDAAGNAYVSGHTLANDFPLVNPLKTSASLHKTTDGGANWNNTNSGLKGDVSRIAIAPSAPNTMYAGALGGVFRSADGGSTWTSAASIGLGQFPFVSALAVDPTNATIVYAAPLTGGVFKSVNGGDNWTPVNIPLGSSIAATIVFDPSTPSTLYVGCTSGVFRSTDSGNSWTALNNFGLATAPNVRALAIDPNTPATIYAGTFGNGVFKTVNGGSSWTASNAGLGGGDPMNVTSIVIDPFNSSTLFTGHTFKNGLPSINKSENGGTSWFPLNNGGAQINKLVADRTTAGTVYAATLIDGVIKTTNGGTSWSKVTNGLWKQNVQDLVIHPSTSTTLFAGTFGDAAEDAFVTKLNASGSGLLFSTYLGGSGGELASGIAVDAGGNIYVVGQTSSKNFPVVNAVQPAMSSPDSCVGEAFVTKINPAVPSYGFSTYLGGSKCDAAVGVALDPAANVYVTGNTSSTNFPVVNAFQPAAADQFFGEAFVTKLTSTGSFIYSTYLGGNVSDTAHAIAADASGNAYITGTTSSSTFPTLGAIQATNNGSQGDVFVTKLNSQGSALVYSTFLGGSNADVGRGIAVDAAGNAYVAGYTRSLEFPIVAGALRTKSAAFKSVNGATSWSNDNYGLRAGTVYNVVVHPTQPSTIYVATSNGVFKSTNGGRTWTAMNTGLTSQHVIALVIDPLTPSTLYAACNELGGSIHNGVYKSTDSAVNWIPHRNGMVNTQMSSLAIDPVTPTTLYAGTFGGPIYKSTDGAANWAPSGVATPGFAISLAVDKFAPATIYAADSSSGGGIRKSVDGGVTWQLLPMDPVPGGFSVSVSPHTAGVVYAGTNLGLFKSSNGGNSWSLVKNGIGRVVFDPVSSSTLYFLSGSEGVFKSTDNGQTWIAMNKGLQLTAALAMAIDPFQPSILHLLSSPAGGEDAFVSKINASGKALIYSTFVGGNTGEMFGMSAEAFAIALDSGGNAYITGLARPNFTTTLGAYQTVSRGFDDAFISKLSMSYTIGGHVLNTGGQPLFDAEVVLSDGVSLTSVRTESDGAYEFSRLREGGSFTVSAAKPQFTITPASQTFNNLNSNQSLDFLALQSDSPFYFINGQITNNGIPLAGVTVTLSGSQPGLRTTDSNGNYSFQLMVAGNYTVTPSLLGFAFGPTSQTFNPLTSDQTANFAATRQSFVVTNANNDGPGSLRDAIINANATVGPDTIVFNIPGPGVKSIKAQNALPDITEQVTIDATTQTGYAGAPLIEVDGTQAGDNNGIVIKASGSTLRGLAVGGFRGFGIVLSDSNNNTIQGNYIGLDATGTQERPNTYGILIATSSNNLIGGTTAAARNVISGNTFYGIEIGGTGNVIQGNFIGTNATGTAAIPNDQAGIDIPSSQYTGNLIGGDTPGAGNLISGNGRGITITAPSNTIQGNLIGTDVTGTNKIENNTGIRVEGANNLVGGLTPGARNVISGNLGDGVIISGTGSKLQGNYIGTDITGTLALGNGGGVLASVSALIGGTASGARNIIAASGMQTRNVEVETNGPNSGVTVQGNYIGIDVTGTRALGNTIIGIRVSGVGHTIGGAVAGAGNVISGHGFGIYLVGDGFVPGQGNTVQGNLIGLNALGAGPLPNAVRGIEVAGASNTTIGGIQPGAANKIAFNGGPGINIPLGFNNSIRGNSIFSNDGLGIDLGSDGVAPNDVGDIDIGGNNLQNFPVLTSVTSGGGSTTIQGTLNSKPNTTFEIDFYSSAALDPSGNGEGAQFFNTTSIVTNSNGTGTINVTFPVALGAGRVITATATDPAGNTSEFSSGDATNAAGNVQFSVPAMWVIEDVGVATINVVRHGGSVGSLSVDYATADGTAIAGQDYTAASGTLTFANGETSKTIQVPIANDSPTEAEEGFTISLRNPSTLEALGAPAVLKVFIQDRTTTPFIFIRDNSIVEGPSGTTTNATFTVNLSAATGQTISVNYATGNGTAIGGASCSNGGTDFENTAGALTFQPGTSSLPISVKICGDANAEANEFFVIGLANATNATVGTPQAFITIMNDELLGLLLEDPSPNVNQAAAIDALLFVRDPFRIVTVPEMFANGSDRNTRVAFFATGLQLDPGETASSVIVRFVGSNNQTHDVPAENVLPVPNTEFTQVIVRLPDGLTTGTTTVTLRAHGRSSNIGTIRIAP